MAMLHDELDNAENTSVVQEELYSFSPHHGCKKVWVKNLTQSIPTKHPCLCILFCKPKMSASTPPENNPYIIDRQRKRCPSEHITENGDPFAKKVKTVPTTVKCSNKTPSTKVAAPATKALTCKASLEDIPEPAQPQKPQPRNPQRILEASDGSDDDAPAAAASDDMPGLSPIEIDDTNKEPEDDLAELRKPFIYFSHVTLANNYLDRLSKDWDTPVYVFFKPIPHIWYHNGRKAHEFECAASRCKAKTKFVHRFLDKGDAKSTSNLRRHAKICWGEEAVTAADGTRDVKTARKVLSTRKDIDGSITAAFQCAGKGQVTYSHHQHTKTEAR